MSTFEIGLDAWIIQDGNYPDFKTGTIVPFAVEAVLTRLDAGAENRQYLTPKGHGRYDFAGRITYMHEDVYGLDLGALQTYTSPRAEIDPRGGRSDWEWIEGELLLGVDPFFYAQEYWDLPNMPALIYPWQIEAIDSETTPWQLTTDSHGGVIQSRVEGERSFRRVGATDAWKDDDGNAHYVLHCRATGEPVLRA